ncbi:unnamed protein product [Protopolystoma xenopodis]|uniref:Uncharacterized protein n=1 Tax=Protopolystoma xenopodis TaxID=117903 RepID=A0A448WN29_9PLAT|nr:unnamed protein product [Protopolystoma xenopodis]
MKKTFVGRSERMRTDETRTAAVWLLDDIHVDAVHPKGGRKSYGLRQHEYRLKAKRLQYNEIHQSSSGQIDRRISSSCTLIRSKGPPNNK